MRLAFTLLDAGRYLFQNFYGRFFFKPMLATLSPENLISTWLRANDCAGDSLVEIAKQVGVRVSRGGLSLALNGKKALDAPVAEKLLQLIDELSCLQDAVAEAMVLPAIHVDWTKTETISTAVTARRLKDLSEDDERFVQFADSLTKLVK
jgi:hypothetical protein